MTKTCVGHPYFKHLLVTGGWLMQNRMARRDHIRFGNLKAVTLQSLLWLATSSPCPHPTFSVDSSSVSSLQMAALSSRSQEAFLALRFLQFSQKESFSRKFFGSTGQNISSSTVILPLGWERIRLPSPWRTLHSSVWREAEEISGVQLKTLSIPVATQSHPSRSDQSGHSHAVTITLLSLCTELCNRVFKDSHRT